VSVHGGHRQRTKERFRAFGLDAFQDHEALELLLFFALPRKDVNPLAHRLIDRFGSLAGVFDATVEDLLKVEGVGESTSLLIRMIPEMARKYMLSRTSLDNILESSAQINAYLKSLFIGLREEVVYLICLDGKRKVLNCTEVGRGIVNATQITIRKILEAALGVGATMVILAHNHPAGHPFPSVEDVATTRRLIETLGAAGILLIDHVIVTNTACISMKSSREYQSLFNR